jgi:hypothetical protein
MCGYVRFRRSLTYEFCVHVCVLCVCLRVCVCVCVCVCVYVCLPSRTRIRRSNSWTEQDFHSRLNCRLFSKHRPCTLSTFPTLSTRRAIHARCAAHILSLSSSFLVPSRLTSPFSIALLQRQSPILKQAVRIERAVAIRRSSLAGGLLRLALRTKVHASW